MCIGDSMHAADIAGKSSRLIHQTEPAACQVPFPDGPGRALAGQGAPGGRPARAHGTVVGGLAGTAVTRRGAGRARSGWGPSWGSLTACLPLGWPRHWHGGPLGSAARRRTSGVSASSPMNPKIPLFWAIVKHVSFRSPGWSVPG